MNDLFQDPFSGLTTSHKSDQTSLNMEHDDATSKKSEVVKKKERATKRKALHFDSDISLSNDDIADLQQGLRITLIQSEKECISVEWCVKQLQEPPICKQFQDLSLGLGSFLKEIWEPLDLYSFHSLEISKSKRQKGNISYDKDQEIFRDVSNYDTNPRLDDSKKDNSMEPELFRNALSDYSAPSLETPSRLPWHSHAGSTGNWIILTNSVKSIENFISKVY